MKNTFKKISAIAVLVTLIASSGLFGVKAQAAGVSPSSVNISLSATTVNAGDSITIRTTYVGDTATSIKYEFYSPYAVYDYNLNAYGYSTPYYYSYGYGIGSFSFTATSLVSGTDNTFTIPSNVYGSYTVKATVTNASGKATSTGSLFVNNMSLDTAKPSILNISVGVKNNGSKEYVEVTASATDAYARAGQTSSKVAAVQVAFENTAKPGTWTSTMTLLPVNDNNEVFYGRLDISSIKEPGTYVLNYATVADTSGNVATYKKSGGTLKSSSSDLSSFPRDLDKITFSAGEVTEEPSTANKNSQTQNNTNAATSGNTVTSPKTSENGAVIPALILLTVLLCSGICAVTVMAKRVK